MCIQYYITHNASISSAPAVQLIIKTNAAGVIDIHCCGPFFFVNRNAPRKPATPPPATTAT